MDGSWAWLVGYAALHAPLCLYGAHRLWLQLGLLGAVRPVPAALPEPPPLVTVQIPLFNEKNVVERIIAAVAALDWPRDRLEIQVLDDSTDETTERARAACAGLVAGGLDAKVLHRSDRAGFKAGALAAGLAVARGDVIAIFDADFVPPSDFLRRTVPYLVAGYGMVQARWGHLNERTSPLTRLQAILLDGHFVVEQASRARQGRWFQFNGTAGVWARRTIDRAGGWSADTLTEDLDLSYRAQLAGERFAYLPELVAPAELPADLTAFKAQQHRWTKGMTQALRISGPRIFGARAPILTRVEALLHLSSVVAWPLVTLVAVTLPVGVWARVAGWLVVPPAVDVAVFALASGAIASFFAVAAIFADRRGLVGRLAAVPVAMILAVGLSLAQSLAFFEGLGGPTGEFERTPKAGDARRSGYRARKRPVVLAEVALAVWLLGAAVAAIALGHPGASPYLVLLGAGYAFVGGAGVIDALRASRTASNPRPASSGSQVAGHSQAGSDHAPVVASNADKAP